MNGCVYLIGAGPGAPDLLTLRAADILKRAGIVFYDSLVHPSTLALAERAEKIAVGKRCGRRSTAQKFINKRLVDAANKHQVVARLKGGDPLLFGRAQEEIDALRQAGVDFEIVPGVTAATAAAAEIGISLTRRGISRHVAFVGRGARAGSASKSPRDRSMSSARTTLTESPATATGRDWSMEMMSFTTARRPEGSASTSAPRRSTPDSTRPA